MYRMIFKLLAMFGLAFFLHDRDTGGRGRGSRGVTPMLQHLYDERQSLLDFIDQTVAGAEEAQRDLSQSERETLDTTRDRIGQLDRQIEPMEAFEQLRDTSRQTTARYTGGGGEDDRRSLAHTEPRRHEYRSAGEFLADAWRAQNRNDENARDRLRTHDVEVNGQGMLTRAAAPHNTTAEVTGLLPTPIVGAIMSDVDAARPFVSSVGPKDLGGIPGTSFERPTVTQHVTVGKQTAEKAELPNRQFTVGGVPFTKNTYGGWANVSRQSIDWTSPGVWDALMTDFIEQYAIETENVAADAFAAAVTQTVESGAAAGADPDEAQLMQALYSAASDAYQGSGRLPDTIWASLDWWVRLGVLFDKLALQGGNPTTGNLGSFAGNLLQANRVIVPSFPTGTLIVGVRSRTEVYEDRIGFLSAVSPKVFGVELAYGGYMANGTVRPAAFAKVVNAV